MNAIARKIKTASTVMIVLSLLLCTATLTVTIIMQVDSYKTMSNAHVVDIAPAFWLTQIAPYLRAGLYAFLAYIFSRISKDLTPFSERLPRLLKVLAIAFFIVEFAPELLIAVLPNLLQQGDPYIPYALLFTDLVVSLTIYSFALMFQYGALLQTDSNEIV